MRGERVARKMGRRSEQGKAIGEAVIGGNSSLMRKENLEKIWKVLRHQQVEMVGSFLSGWKGFVFFFLKNALLITVHQIISLWKFPVLLDSYFKFVLGRNFLAAGSWHFWQAVIIHVFLPRGKEREILPIWELQVGWRGGAEPGACSQPSAWKPHTMAILSP